MTSATIAALRRAVDDRDVVGRYRSHIITSDETACHLWTGAITGKGHGRFQVGSETIATVTGVRRKTYVVIAHRFGYALSYGVEELLKTPIVAHWMCDNPLCQNPVHWRASDHHTNTREYANRRATIGSPFADLRGARGRAHAIRAAARAGRPISGAVLAGLPRTHFDQLPLFDELLSPSTDLEQTSKEL